MSYTIEKLDGCSRKISFNFDSLDISKETSRELKKKQKQANLKGFRKGKAPLSFVEKMFKAEIQSEAINQFMNNQLQEVLKSEELNPVSSPNVTNMDYSGGNDLKFDIMVEIYPEFKIEGLEKLSFTKNAVVLDDKEVEDLKKRYLQSKAEMEVLSDEAAALENGHHAIINYHGKLENGETLEGLNAEEFSLEMGSGQLLKEFEDGLLGMKKGEKKTINMTFPADYFDERLKSKAVTFELELLEIKKMNVPELTDELAVEFGFESAKDFAEKTRKNLFSEKEKAAEQQLHQEILEKLIENNPFDVPSTFVARQSEAMEQEMTQNMKQQGYKEEQIAESLTGQKEEIIKRAIFSVKSSLILDHIGRENKIEATEADLDKKLEESSKAYGMTVEEIKKLYNSNEKMLGNLKYGIREEKIFAKIYEMTNIE